MIETGAHDRNGWGGEWGGMSSGQGGVVVGRVGRVVGVVVEAGVSYLLSTCHVGSSEVGWGVRYTRYMPYMVHAIYENMPYMGYRNYAIYGTCHIWDIGPGTCQRV